MAKNAFENTILAPLDSQSIRAFQAFRDFPWLNGIILSDGSLEEKLAEMLQNKDGIPEPSILAIKVWLLNRIKRVNNLLLDPCKKSRRGGHK
jgi:hypothetical protein